MSSHFQLAVDQVGLEVCANDVKKLVGTGCFLSGRCGPGQKPVLDDPFLLMLYWGGTRDAGSKGKRKGGTIEPRPLGDEARHSWQVLME